MTQVDGYPLSHTPLLVVKCLLESKSLVENTSRSSTYQLDSSTTHPTHPRVLHVYNEFHTASFIMWDDKDCAAHSIERCG